MTLDLTTILGGIAGVVMLVMSMMIKSARSDKKVAEMERDKEKTKSESLKKRVEAHEKRQQIENDIAIGDMPNHDGVRDPYDRDSSS